MPTYRLFGVVVATEHQLRANLVEAEPQLRICLTDSPPMADWQRSEELHVEGSTTDQQPAIRFFRLPDRDVIRIEDAADFHVEDELITVHVVHRPNEYVIPIALYGLVFAFWLERRRVTTLHGSAVAVRERAAVAFLGPSGAGKSSMAATLTALGAPLISEDLLVIRLEHGPVIEPGLAQLRLWPEQLARHWSDWQQFERPHPGFDKRLVPVGPEGFGRLATSAVPLAAILVLDRSESTSGGPSIESLDGPNAMAELLRHSYLPIEAERFGWQADRFHRLAELLDHIPVSRLRYPSGAQHTASVGRAINEVLDR